MILPTNDGHPAKRVNYAEETEIGRVEITRAEARFSRAKIIGEETFDANGATLRRIVKM